MGTETAAQRKAKPAGAGTMRNEEVPAPHFMSSSVFSVDAKKRFMAAGRTSV